MKLTGIGPQHMLPVNIRERVDNIEHVYKQMVNLHNTRFAPVDIRNSKNQSQVSRTPIIKKSAKSSSLSRNSNPGPSSYFHHKSGQHDHAGRPLSFEEGNAINVGKHQPISHSQTVKP